MKLAELEPHFIRRELREDGEYHVYVDALADADGIFFLCPKCFAANGGPVGTHAVICWRPRVPPDVDPKPGRWEFEGTGLSDLTLKAGSSSILLTGPGCQAHFFITNGAIC